MLVSPNDSFKKKAIWSLITFLLETLIILIFWVLPFIMMRYNKLCGIISFLAGVFLSQKLINCIENHIGMFCSLQNPNRHNLIRLDLFVHPPECKSQSCKRIKKSKSQPCKRKIKKR